MKANICCSIYKDNHIEIIPRDTVTLKDLERLIDFEDIYSWSLFKKHF